MCIRDRCCVTVLGSKTKRGGWACGIYDAVNTRKLCEGRAQDEPHIIWKGLGTFGDGTGQTGGLLAQSVHLPVTNDKSWGWDHSSSFVATSAE